MSQTPPLAPQDPQDHHMTAFDDAFLLSILQDPPLISLCRNASHQGSSGSQPEPFEIPSLSNLDALPLSLPLPSPVFLSEFTPHWSDDNPQMRPLPQERVPPSNGLPPRAEAFPPNALPQIASPSQPSQSWTINHPNPLGSNPPQGPAAMMEQNPQFPFAPSSVPPIAMQEALQSGNVVQAGMQLRPDDLRQSSQFPLPQRQPDHGVPQGGGQYHWDFPGREIILPAPNDPPVEGQRLTGESIWIRVGGKAFRLPMNLLSESPFWSALTVFEPPPQGWSISDGSPEIFTILIDCVYSASGLHGTESGLNLVKLCYAINLAKSWGMIQDRRKLRDTAYRYIIRRVMHYDPNLPDECRFLDCSHYLYRSEELYRTWELSQRHNSIQKMFPQHDLIALYCCVIPQSAWPVLTARFTHEFTMLLNVHVMERRSSAGGTDEIDYRSWWLHYYRLAGFQDAHWLSSDAQNRLFGTPSCDEDGGPQERAEFEAARARGSALVNAFEAQQSQQQQPVTPIAPVSPSVFAEFNASLDNALSSAYHCEIRRVHFEHLPEIIGLHQQVPIQMATHDEAFDLVEEEIIHGEAAPAGLSFDS